MLLCRDSNALNPSGMGAKCPRCNNLGLFICEYIKILYFCMKLGPDCRAMYKFITISKVTIKWN